MALKFSTLQAKVGSAHTTTKRAPLVQVCPAVVAVCSHSPAVQQQPLFQQLGKAAAAATLALSLAVLPMGSAVQAAQPQQLADLLREQFGFVDSNNDGIVTRCGTHKAAATAARDSRVADASRHTMYSSFI